MAPAYEGPFSRLEHHLEHLTAGPRRRRGTIPRHLRCEYYDGTVLCPDGQRIQLHYAAPTQTPGRWPDPKPGDPPPY